MIKVFLCGIFFSICTIGNSYAQTKVPAPFGPVPPANQMRWQKMEYYAFVHFSLNTYTDQSWGYGNEDVKLFNPEKLNGKGDIYLPPWDRNHPDYGKPEYIFCLFLIHKLNFK